MNGALGVKQPVCFNVLFVNITPKNDLTLRFYFELYSGNTM